MRALPLLVAISLAAAACRSVALEGGDCGRVYDGGCEQVMGELVRRWPGEAQRIDLQCSIAACDRLRGAGSALVTFADGRTTVVPWSYEGDPVPAPACDGLGELLCRTVHEAVAEGLPPSSSVRAMTITCVDECAWTGGETRVDLVLDDGTTRTQGYGWDGGFPLPSGYSSLPGGEAGPFRAMTPAPSGR